LRTALPIAIDLNPGGIPDFRSFAAHGFIPVLAREENGLNISKKLFCANPWLGHDFPHYRKASYDEWF
jgi:hypothetical protein